MPDVPSCTHADAKQQLTIAASSHNGEDANNISNNNNNNNNNNQYIYKQRQSHAMSQRRWLATAVIFRPSDVSLGFAET